MSYAVVHVVFARIWHFLLVYCVLFHSLWCQARCHYHTSWLEACLKSAKMASRFKKERQNMLRNEPDVPVMADPASSF